MLDEALYSIIRGDCAPKVIRSGGYLPPVTTIGSNTQFTIGGPIGYGSFSTIYPLGADRAVKVFCAGEHEEFGNEARIYNKIAAAGGSPYILRHHGFFTHIELNTNLQPQIFPCVIFDRAPTTLNKLMRYINKKYETGLPISIAKMIGIQCLHALDFLHREGIVHTDFKPENILLNKTIEEIESGAQFSILLSDFGRATTLPDIFKLRVGTPEYSAPECDLMMPFDQSADIWSFCTSLFTLITQDLLFDVEDELPPINSDESDESADGESADESANDKSADGESADESANDESDNESTDGESDDYPTESNDSIRYDDSVWIHKKIALVERILGPLPTHLRARALELYGSDDIVISPSSVLEELVSSYDIGESATIIADVISAGLHYDPQARATAHMLLTHPFFTS